MTEPTYIRGFERMVRNSTVAIEIPNTGGVPLTLVRAAVRLKEEAEREAARTSDPFAAYDEVWCVFDVDDHPAIPGATQLAASHGVELTISNPCFELWLVLHFRDSPGMRHRDEIHTILRGFVPGYDKRFRFEVVADGVDDAATRARRIDRDAQEMGEVGRNPSTSVYRLTASIARR